MKNREILEKHLNAVANLEIANGLAYRVQRNAMIANQYQCNTFTSSPEEVYLESERVSLIRFFLRKLLKSITKTQRKYLFAYIRNDYNASQTGEVLGVFENTIRYHIGKIRERAFELVLELELTVPDFKELVTPEIGKFNRKAGRIAGFPYEQFMNLDADAKWTCKFGTKRFSVTKTCMIPEYLENTGCSDSICPICNGAYNCSRVDKFPDNKRYNDKVKERLDSLDIYLDMIADSYTEEECKEFGIKKISLQLSREK